MITDSPNSFADGAPNITFGDIQPFDTEGLERISNYYTIESAGIATGFLLCALNKSGLATQLHTPPPITILNKILNRFDFKMPT